MRKYAQSHRQYGKFLPELATILEPLHHLLRKGSRWSWTADQQRAFDKSKELLQSSRLLTHFDNDKELILACDASPYGVGAVLAHRMLDGEEKPIAYALKTLNVVERNYSQYDKEGLAIMFGV